MPLHGRRRARHHRRRVLHAERSEPGAGGVAGGVKEGKRHQAQRLRLRQPRQARARARSRSPSRPSPARSSDHGVSPRRGAPARRRLRSSRVALVERRGKFLVAEPFFGPGPRLAVSRDSRYDVGDLVAVTPGTPGRGGKGSRARVHRRLGKPDVARDVIEALMVDRGLARGFEAPVSRAAKAASETEIGVGCEPPRPARAADLHDRSRAPPRTSTTRSPASRPRAAAGRSGSTSPT